jgi:hypothetical protein
MTRTYTISFEGIVTVEAESTDEAFDNISNEMLGKHVKDMIIIEESDPY